MGENIASIFILARGWWDFLRKTALLCSMILYFYLFNLMSVSFFLQIPHIFKPEVQFVEFSIEQFFRSGKKDKDDTDFQKPVTLEKLNVAETNLVAKYFQQHDIAWKPSLIAFPHFQTYPSRVYKVMHSPRTRMLIDTMQSLQGLSFSSDRKISFIEV